MNLTEFLIMFILLISCQHLNASNLLNSSPIADTIPVKSLEEVTVTPHQQTDSLRRTSYIPDRNALKSSQNGIDLLNRMGVPQIEIDPVTKTIQAVGGGDVAIFIDYIPANKDDLSNMLTADVRRVDYYDHPSDPRFLNNTRVLNFIMRRYNYGGYVKLNAGEDFLIGKGNIQGMARMRYKRMTYDVMGLSRYESNGHTGNERVELFKFPEQTFTRHTSFSKAKYRQQYHQANARALYNSDKITADNRIGFGLENIPHNDFNGTVTYDGIGIPTSVYHSLENEKNKFLNFLGEYYFNLSDRFSLSSDIDYTYSMTKDHSSYLEENFNKIINNASDRTQTFDATILASYNAGSNTRLNMQGRLHHAHSHTSYSGSVSVLERSDITMGMVGVNGSTTLGNLYGYAAFGWRWIRSSLNSKRSLTSEPYMDLFLKYSINARNSISLTFHHAQWEPSQNLKSEIQMQVSPFMWHTGNPRLKAYKSYDLGVTYMLLPSNRLNVAVFSGLCAITDRYCYIYEPMQDNTGILRTIGQPMGLYAFENVGAVCTLRLIDNRLMLRGNITQIFYQNRKPYYHNISYTKLSLQAFYYLGDFNFSASYDAPKRYYDGSSTPAIIKSRDYYAISAGWAKGAWNLNLSLRNIFRWDWKTFESVSDYECYSDRTTYYGTDRHANIALTATYSIDFGRKTNRENELREQQLNSSGILR
ncbi:hypothetical protein [Lepagella muris]|uniref:Uncharacterized protein n=1 Tax=Lepagella muris TaxID=3032870 RepID=A0AC61RC97_9BACT|nr:hypothetical protein [Lepagella muris]TGY75099.1 hypothetical protein E5331_19980 [Lepagella muris]THG45590.1 hypothetical protein E5984_19965 [Bacteroidales bacterium]TKC54106.1 hypothetical protein E5359_019990 [Bacteroidales bacterium]